MRTFRRHRPDLRDLAVLRGGGVELERVADPRPLGVSLPNLRKPPPVAAGRLHLRPRLHRRHPRLPAAAAVRPRGRHRGQWHQQTSDALFSSSEFSLFNLELFQFQCDKKDMRENYMTTERFKVRAFLTY